MFSEPTTTYGGNVKKKLASIAVGIGAAVAFAAPAIAASSGSFTSPLGPAGAKFIDGRWSFDPWPCTSACVDGKWSAFNYSGYLKDNDADGDWVYTRGKIDGYGWAGGASAENHGGYPTKKWVSQAVDYGDPPQQGKIQVCVHRAGVIPNVCTESGWKYR